MLKIFRRSQESFWIKAFLLLLAGSFFVGFLVLPAARQGSADDIVAVVGGDDQIYRRDVRAAVENLRQRYREQVGAEAYQQLRDYLEERLADQAFEQLLDARAARVWARDLGFATSAVELRRVITENPGFQIEGKFSPSQYRKFIERNRTSETEYEKELGDQLTLQKLSGLVADQIKVSQAELEQRYRDENTKVALEVFLVDPADLSGEATVSEEEVKKYYDAHAVDFFQPERRDVSYLVFNPRGAPYLGMEEVNAISDIEAGEYYEANRSKYILTDKAWRVRDILFATKPTGEDDTRSEEARKEEARKRAETALKQIESGTPFTKLANERSDDLATKRLQNGGVLAGGYVSAGYFKKKVFEQFSQLAEGQRSGVFEAIDGYHIVEVEKIYEAGTLKPLADVEQQVKTQVRFQKAGRLAQRDAEKALQEVGGRTLSDYALEDPENRRLEVATLSREDPLPKVGRAPDLVGRIFDELAPKMRPVLMEANNLWLVLQVGAVHDPQPAPLAEVRQDVENILLEEKTREHARELAEQLRAEAAGGAKGSQLSRRHKALVVEDTEPFARTGRESGGDTSGVDVIPKLGKSAQLKAVAFTLREPGAVTPGVYELGAKLAFARLKSRTDPDLARFSFERKPLEQRIKSERRQAIIQDLLSRARKEVRVEVRIPLEQLKAELAPLPSPS